MLGTGFHICKDPFLQNHMLWSQNASYVHVIHNTTEQANQRSQDAIRMSVSTQD